MRGARAVLVLAVVTLVAVGAVLFVERGPAPAEPGGDTVFPTLLEQVNAVARVRVTGSEGTFTLARDGDAWVVEEKERHPADPDRVHRLLVGAAGMKRIEPKTSNPERYPKLWLEDPSGEDARSVGFVLEDASGAALARWVLGDRRPSKSDAGRTELYIRIGDDPLAWLVEGSVPGGRHIIDWLDRRVARIDRERLRGVEVSHADGAVVAVDKPLPADNDFVLRDVPEGREVDSRYRINDIGRFLEDLRFEDVAPVSELDFAGSPDKRVQVATFDGLRVHLDSVMRDGEAWVRLRAEVDEELVDEGLVEEGLPGEAAEAGAAVSGAEADASGAGAAASGAKADTSGADAAASGAKADTSGADAAASGAEADASGADAAASGADADTSGAGAAASGGGPGPASEDTPGALRPLDEVRTEAERLNARWRGWAYELPSFKRDYIARRMDELTRAVEGTDEDPGGSDS